MLVDLVRLDLLFDRRGRQCQHSRPLAFYIPCVEEVAHNQVIQVILVRVVSFIQDQQVNVLHFKVAVHEQIVEFLRNEHENVILAVLLNPVLVLVHLLVVLSTYTRSNRGPYLKTCQLGQSQCSAQ